MLLIYVSAKNQTLPPDQASHRVRKGFKLRLSRGPITTHSSIQNNLFTVYPEVQTLVATQCGKS